MLLRLPPQQSVPDKPAPDACSSSCSSSASSSPASLPRPSPPPRTPDRPLSPLSLPIGPLSPVPTRPSPYSRRSGSSLLDEPPQPLERPNPFDFLPSPPPEQSQPPSEPLPPDDPPPPLPPHPPALPPAPSVPALQIAIPASDANLNICAQQESMAIDAPPPDADGLDFSFDDEKLSALEKIYLFSQSQANFHRVLITRALPSILPQVTSAEAVEYVLPLLSGLAMDDDEGVKEALADELVSVVWWFATNCLLIEDEALELAPLDPTPLSIRAFTPVIGTLLLSGASVGAVTRVAVVDLLRRLREAAPEDAEGLLSARERRLLEEEIIDQVVIGIGQLDMADEDDEQPPLEQASGPASADEVWAVSDPRETWRSGAEGASVPAQPETGISHALAQTPFVSSRNMALAGPDLPLPPPPPPPPPPARLPSPPPEAQSEEGDHNAIQPMNVDSVVPTHDDSYVDAEQAAVGRLSSMSLMAAVSAGGLLADEKTGAFVREVERVGLDPVYWVRKEASYALGALAKVVPREVVMMSLLPLFERLTTDPVWHVRHSALFAFPAILSRLSPNDRRTLALHSISALSQDGSAAVRTRLLETLGEVIYTFRDDPGGPPNELLHLFLGPEASKLPPVDSPFARQHLRRGSRDPDPPLPTPSPTPPNDEGPRPLICAFNLPAVALTLGSRRWPELRPLYARLACARDSKVRRTLAASAGALARVVALENAWRDVFPVWVTSIRADEPGVRSKAIEAVSEMVDVLGFGPSPSGQCLLAVLHQCWRDRVLGWREREALVVRLRDIVRAGALERARGEDVDRFAKLVLAALEDETAAVRQAGVATLPIVLGGLARWPATRALLEAGSSALASSASFRFRMTFVACYKELVLEHADGERWLRDNRFAGCLDALSGDAIVDVRIGVARFVGQAFDRFYRPGTPSSPSPTLQTIFQRLRGDASPGVRAYVAREFSSPPHAPPQLDARRQRESEAYTFATFSLPPPPRAGAASTPDLTFQTPSSHLSPSEAYSPASPLSGRAAEVPSSHARQPLASPSISQRSPGLPLRVLSSPVRAPGALPISPNSTKSPLVTSLAERAQLATPTTPTYSDSHTRLFEASPTSNRIPPSSISDTRLSPSPLADLIRRLPTPEPVLSPATHTAHTPSPNNSPIAQRSSESGASVGAGGRPSAGAGKMSVTPPPPFATPSSNSSNDQSSSRSETSSETPVSSPTGASAPRPSLVRSNSGLLATVRPVQLNSHHQQMVETVAAGDAQARIPVSKPDTVLLSPRADDTVTSIMLDGATVNRLDGVTPAGIAESESRAAPLSAGVGAGA